MERRGKGIGGEKGAQGLEGVLVPSHHEVISPWIAIIGSGILKFCPALYISPLTRHTHARTISFKRVVCICSQSWLLELFSVFMQVSVLEGWKERKKCKCDRVATCWWMWLSYTPTAWGCPGWSPSSAYGYIHGREFILQILGQQLFQRLK